MDKPMRFIAAVSSNITAFGYSVESKELVVQFENGGRYSYAEVPPEIVTCVMFAESQGKAFDALIKKGGYKFEKLDD